MPISTSFDRRRRISPQATHGDETALDKSPQKLPNRRRK
jgi:hypothetical protein